MAPRFILRLCAWTNFPPDRARYGEVDEAAQKAQYPPPYSPPTQQQPINTPGPAPQPVSIPQPPTKPPPQPQAGPSSYTIRDQPEKRTSMPAPISTPNTPPTPQGPMPGAYNAPTPQPIYIIQQPSRHHHSHRRVRSRGMGTSWGQDPGFYNDYGWGYGPGYGPHYGYGYGDPGPSYGCPDRHSSHSHSSRSSRSNSSSHRSSSKDSSSNQQPSSSADADDDDSPDSGSSGS